MLHRHLDQSGVQELSSSVLRCCGGELKRKELLVASHFPCSRNHFARETRRSVLYQSSELGATVDY